MRSDKPKTPIDFLLAQVLALVPVFGMFVSVACEQDGVECSDFVVRILLSLLKLRYFASCIDSWNKD